METLESTYSCHGDNVIAVQLPRRHSISFVCIFNFSATPGCENGRELLGDWRENSRRISSAKHEASNFGNDGWVYFTQGLGRMPESPPPLSVGGK